MKCSVCNKDYTSRSLGGPGTCPSCDCGNKPITPNPFYKHLPYRTEPEKYIPKPRGQKCDLCGSTAIDHTEALCQIYRMSKDK